MAVDWSKSKFGKWAKQYGVLQLEAELRRRRHSITFSAIYQWLRGETRPRIEVAREIVRIAGGAVTLDEIYDHLDEVRNEHASAGAVA